MTPKNGKTVHSRTILDGNGTFLTMEYVKGPCFLSKPSVLSKGCHSCLCQNIVSDVLACCGKINVFVGKKRVSAYSWAFLVCLSVCFLVVHI